MKTSLWKSASAGLLAAALLLGVGCSRDKSVGQNVDDTAITTKVKAAFVQDPAVRAMDVKVDTHLGTVQLSGFVRSPEEKMRAEEIAKSVAGVRVVENKITLRTEASQPTP